MRSSWRPRVGPLLRGLLSFGVVAATLLTAAPGIGNAAAATADPPSCRVVRLADVGWTAETATTAVLGQMLTDLGYKPVITVLSVPVTFESMKNGDIDVFLGNWIPAQESMLKPFTDEGSVEVVRNNLEGAKYTLGVPDYLYDAGLKDFADINRFRKELGASIYGIEPGNDGNHLILELIKKNEFGLGGFKLVESSEQGMLAQVERAYRTKQPVVFLAWAPHPMNTHFNVRYLTGGDATFGPNYGAATVRTLVRKGFQEECPNVTRLLKNLEFSVELENMWMDRILSDKVRTADLAVEWLAKRDPVVQTWLTGVTGFDGQPAFKAVDEPTKVAHLSAFEDWITANKIPVGDAATTFVEYTKKHAHGLFDGIAAVLTGATNVVARILNGVPAPALIVLIAGLSWVLRRSIGLVVFIILALLFIMNQGYWDATIETLTLVLVAAIVATVIGVPMGIWGAKRPRVYAGMRPVLDLMQTLPTFVYLTPTLVLFGLGIVPGLISTIIFALPAPIRLTQLGISSVPKTLREAGQAFGATPLQLLFKVELPSAGPMILAGITQCIMLSLSMVVIAALVGAGGLGVPVVRALNTVQVGMGFEAGIAIVLLAIMLDRISRPAEKKGQE
ncbi:MAG: Glycine betaine transport system permease protein OpuAB [Pseudomonadota bacterium]